MSVARRRAPGDDGAARPERVDGGAEPSPQALLFFRGGFIAVVAALATIAYAALRALQGHFGWSPWWTVAAALPTALMMLFLLPLAPFARLPEIWSQQHRPAARARRGLCPDCGYPRAPNATRCPECGGDGRVRPEFELTAAAIRTFAWMALAALAIGVGAGEALVQLDEHRFRAEAHAWRAGRPGTPFERPRRWPGSFSSLRWSPDRGFESGRP